ncbi:MAG TPA: hypothetical protein VJU61_09455, partial [Polyangiaceae bacterium]|nr:hypothetical protein [Polyangiaceae bacterium]
MSWVVRYGGALAGVVSLGALAPACGAEEEPITGSLLDAGGASLAMDAALCTPQVCQCGNTTGTRRCNDAGQLGNCECAPDPVATPDAAVVFVGSCPTGRYTGNFKGTAGF